MKKLNIGRGVFLGICAILLILICFVCFYPLWYVIVGSLSNADRIMQHTGMLWIPMEMNLDAYKAVFQNRMIYQGYINTLFIVLSGLLVNLTMTTISAYVLAQKRLLIRKGLMVFVTITMFFNGGIIPNYLLIQALHLQNSYLALILPVAINTFNLIIMRTSFEGIPDSLKEAAELDGASHLTVILKVILPLSGPVLAVMTLYYGVGHWNSWFTAMLYIDDRAKYPLQLILREVLIQNDTSSMGNGAGASDVLSLSKTIKYAVIVVSTVPILCLYPFLQRYFVTGALVGAVKE